MSNLNYLAGRKKYGRPQALLFSDTPGTLVQGTGGMVHVPDGHEVNAVPDPIENSRFIILSDHNRGPIDIKNNRIEQKERTINGKMRSFYIADKSTFSVSWQNLPSRSFSSIANFDKETGKLLWEAQLPAAGHATPAVYERNGKQYLVIACGGGKGTKSGDAYVAFALPD